METKEDKDDSEMNAGKLKYATEHFETINGLLKSRRQKRRYYSHFVSPMDYSRFFEALRSAKIDKFVSTLQGSLKP